MVQRGTTHQFAGAPWGIVLLPGAVLVGANTPRSMITELDMRGLLPADALAHGISICPWKMYLADHP